MLDLRSTSRRTFVLWPVVVAARSLWPGTRTDVRFAPVGVAGYALYRLAGTYRTRHGGGGPGMATPPDRLVTTGPYALTRNPMYLGHLVTFGAFVGATRSLVLAAVLGWHVRWFDERAAAGQDRLRARFGDTYARYRDDVARWLPSPASALRAVRPPRRRH